MSHSTHPEKPIGFLALHKSTCFILGGILSFQILENSFRSSKTEPLALNMLFCICNTPQSSLHTSLPYYPRQITRLSGQIRAKIVSRI